MNLTQQGLAERSGVSCGSIRRFEYTGQIALAALLNIAQALRCLDDFQALFAPRALVGRSLDDLMKQPTIRRRGRTT